MVSGRRVTAGRAAAALFLLLVFAATWALLDSSEHRPRWLAVEAPGVAVVGRPLEVRVRLTEPVGPTRIVCTLHRAGSDRRTRERIASAGPARDVAGAGAHTFRFDVPDRENMVFVAAIVYLSPTGEWRDRTRAAHTGLIPVRREAAAKDLQVFLRTPVYPSTTAAEEAAARTAAGAAAREAGQTPSPWDHGILFAVLLATAVLCLVKAGKKGGVEQPDRAAERRVWLVFAVLFILSAFIEISGVVGHLSEWARRMARDSDLYHLRKTFQKAVMAATAAAGLGLFFLFIRAIRRPGSHRSLWWAGTGLAAYLSVSFVSVLSFHAVDLVRGMTWGGISSIDAARGAGALVSLITVVAALGPKRRKARR